MPQLRILAVDNNPDILDTIRDFLSEYRIEIETESDSARQRFKNEYFDVILADYKMPGVSGLDLFLEAKKKRAYRYGILITTYVDISLLKQFLNHGLIKQFLEKPIILPKLKDAVEEAARWCKNERRKELALRRCRKQISVPPKPVIGLDTTLIDIGRDLDRISFSDENILITGETGTGKEIISREIHRLSGRAGKPFVKINCGAIPESLIESELFGFCRGAFSGAEADKPGKIERADGGTLFLDEIAELKPDLQVKLLQVIQEKRIERIGSSISKPVNFRLISATNRDIHVLLKNEKFRGDLYFRISTFHLHLPPLRERREDIAALTRYFLNQYAKELGRHEISLTKEALYVLEQYHWPGNIRELENILKRAVILLDQNSSKIVPASLAGLSLNGDFLLCEEGNNFDYWQAIYTLSTCLKDSSLNLKKIERDMLKRVLEDNQYRVAEAVRKTGIQKDKLYRLLQEIRSE